MSLLFDTSSQDDGPKRKSRRVAAPAPAPAAPALITRPASPAPPLGQLDDGVACLDQTCQAQCLDILDEHRGQWLVECCFCGTKQAVKVIKGHLPEPSAGGEFVLRGGRFDGLSLAQVARLPRGAEYITWAAAEHPRNPVKKACQTYLASVGTAR